MQGNYEANAPEMATGLVRSEGMAVKEGSQPGWASQESRYPNLCSAEQMTAVTGPTPYRPTSGPMYPRLASGMICSRPWTTETGNIGAATTLWQLSLVMGL